MTLNLMEKAVIMILDSVCFFSNEIWNQNLADEARLMVTFWFMLNTFHDFMLIIQFLTQLSIMRSSWTHWRFPEKPFSWTFCKENKKLLAERSKEPVLGQPVKRALLMDVWTLMYLPSLRTENMEVKGQTCISVPSMNNSSPV